MKINALVAYHLLHNYPNILILSTDCYVLGDLILHWLYTNNYNNTFSSYNQTQILRRFLLG